MRFIEYLIACTLAVVLGGWLLQTQIAEPLLRLVEQTATAIAETGGHR